MHVSGTKQFKKWIALKTGFYQIGKILKNIFFFTPTRAKAFKHSNMRESNVRESNIRNAFGARRGSDRQSSARTSGERETHAGK